MSATKVAVLSKDAPAPSPLMSHGIVWNGMVYVSGSLGLDPETGAFVPGDASDRTVSEAMINFPISSQYGFDILSYRCNLFEILSRCLKRPVVI